MILIDNNFNVFNMFLPNFNSFVEFSFSLGVPSCHMESSPPICNINLLTWFYVIGDFSGSYSQTDCKFNFNTNVNVTVEIYLNSSFSFSFSHLLKYLLDSRIINLEVLAKLQHNLRQYCCYCPYSFIYIRETRMAWGLHIFKLILFAFTRSVIVLPLDTHSLN